MKYPCRLIVALLMSLSVFQSAVANTFATQRLSEIASDLHGIAFDTLSCGTHEFDDGLYTIVIRVNGWQEIEHIGIKIFDRQNLAPLQPIAYDFMERYALELQLEKNENSRRKRIQKDDVTIEVGNLSNLFDIRMTDEFQLFSLGFKGYRMAWRRDGVVFLALSFPMDYELMSGCNSIELENNYMRNIERYAEIKKEEKKQDTLASQEIHKTTDFARNHCAFCWSKQGIPFLPLIHQIHNEFAVKLNVIEQEHRYKHIVSRRLRNNASRITPCLLDSIDGLNYTAENHYILEGGTYLSEAIRSAIYYVKDTAGWSLLCSEQEPYGSAYNIALSAVPVGDFCLEGKLDKYGYETAPFSSPFHKWVSFCEQEGGKLYFGIKSIDTTCIKGTIFITFEDMGYCHMMSVEIPISIIRNKKGDVLGRLYVYIPLHNIHEDYYK